MQQQTQTVVTCYIIDYYCQRLQVRSACASINLSLLDDHASCSDSVFMQNTLVFFYAFLFYIKKQTSLSQNMKQLCFKQAAVSTTCISHKHFTVFNVLAHSWITHFKQRRQRRNANSTQNCFAMRSVEPCYLTQHSSDSWVCRIQQKKGFYSRHDEFSRRIRATVFE